MKKWQDKIYYITAENVSSAKNSPHLEIFLKRKQEKLNYMQKKKQEKKEKKEKLNYMQKEKEKEI